MTESPAPRRTGASQDQRLANHINQYRTALTTAQGHAELGSRLQPRGYDAATLTARLGGRPTR